MNSENQNEVIESRIVIVARVRSNERHTKIKRKNQSENGKSQIKIWTASIK